MMHGVCRPTIIPKTRAEAPRRDRCGARRERPSPPLRLDAVCVTSAARLRQGALVALDIVAPWFGFSGDVALDILQR